MTLEIIDRDARFDRLSRTRRGERLLVDTRQHPRETMLAEDLSIEKLELEPLRRRIGTRRGRRGRRVPVYDRPISVRIEHSIASANVSRTIEGASTLTLVINDSDRELLNSGIFDRDENGELDTIDIRLDRLWFRLVKVAKSDTSLTLTFEDREVALLREPNRPRSVSRNDKTRAQFIELLVREIRPRIPLFCPEKNRRQPIGRRTDDENQTRRGRERSRNSDREPGLSRRRRLTVKGARATAEQLRNMEQVLGICDEENSGQKATKACILACIVESTFRNLPGGDATSSGILQVQSGTARSLGINPRSIDQCVRAFLNRGFWGRGGAKKLARDNRSWSAGRVAQNVQGSAYPHRYDEYGSEANAIMAAWTGGSFTGGGEDRTVSRARIRQYRFSRGQNGQREDSWSCMQRLAQEVNWRCFARSGEIWYVSEPWLLRQRPIATISESTEGIRNIDFDWDKGKAVQEVTVSAFASRWGAPPGSVIEVEDMGPIDGKWLVATIEKDLYRPEVTIKLKKGTPPLKEPPAERVTTERNNDDGGVGDGSGRDAVERAYLKAHAIHRRRYPYVWGGGHSRAGRPDGGIPGGPGGGRGLTGYDCSGAVAAVLQAGGMMPEGWANGVPASGTMAQSYGRRGEGRYLTLWANGAHVWLEFKLPGRPGKHWGTGNWGKGWGGAGFNPRMHPKAGFTPRHWPGT